MANKRDLKKQIRYICGDIAAECMIAAEYVKGVDAQAMSKIVSEVAQLQTAALSNSSFGFDKVESDYENRAAYLKAKKAYYKKAYSALRDKFNTKIQEVVKEMNAALPQEVKNANKRAD